jgi:hypothetical protein
MLRAAIDQFESFETSAWRCAWLIVSAVALGAAIHMRDGLVYPSAAAWLAVAMGCAGVAFVKPGNGSSIARRLPRLMPWLLGGGVLLQFGMLLSYRLPEAWHSGHAAWPYYLLVAVAVLLSAAMMLWRNQSRILFALVLVVFLVLGVWVLRAGTRPRIDVWTAQTAGLNAMLRGSDPWSSSFPDVYGHPDLYAAGTVRDGEVHLGFPYPPLTVLLDLPGHLAFGDYRYSNLVAMVVAAISIAGAGGGRTGRMAAVLFLFTPRVFLVLRNGWTEPQVAMLLAGTVFCACRARRLLPVALGLLLVSKQYMVWAVVPSVLLLGPALEWRGALRLLGKAAAVGAVVSLPLALWNFGAFWHSNFVVAAGAQFRFDALSFPALVANVFAWTPPVWIGLVSFVATAMVTVPVMRRAPRSPAGFAAGVAMVFLVFFSLNKFAFCNYYYFVVAILCSSVSATGERALPTQESMPSDREIPLPMAA